MYTSRKINTKFGSSDLQGGKEVNFLWQEGGFYFFGLQFTWNGSLEYRALKISHDRKQRPL